MKRSVSIGRMSTSEEMRSIFELGSPKEKIGRECDSEMEKWRLISLTGIILGIIQHLDYVVEGLTNIVIGLLALILIFAGLIIRKREKNKEQ